MVTRDFLGGEADGCQQLPNKEPHMTAKSNTPETDTPIADETPREAYTEPVKCKYVVGPGRKQCGALRFVKKQDLFQVKYCTTHVKQAANDKRRARQKTKRASKP
jgi:hypothetical protein